MKLQITFVLLLHYIKQIILSSPVLLSKSPLTYSTNKCKDNPMLRLLPKEMKYKTEITLSNKPKRNHQLNFCKIPEEDNNENIFNCCTSYTYTNIKIFLNDYIHLPKQNIHERNLHYYKQLYDEHKRNFVKGFSIPEEQFEPIFAELHQKIKDIIQLSDKIVSESVQYNWEAFCNYICYFPSALNQNCQVYQLKYSYNDKEYDDYEFECKGDKERIEKFKQLIDSFIKVKEEINSTFNNYYKTIRKRIENGSIKTQLDSDMYTLLKKSIDDGNYVALDLNKPFLCTTSPISYILNDYLDYSLVSVDTSCDSIKEKPCGIFSCLDDFYMQFFDVSEFNQSYIVKQFNYTKSQLILSDKESMFSFNYSDDMKHLIDGRIRFDSSTIVNINIVFLVSLLGLVFL